MNKNRMLSGLLVGITLLGLVGIGGALYLTSLGAAIDRDVQFKSNGNTRNPEVRQLLSTAFWYAHNAKDYRRALNIVQQAHQVEPENRAISFRMAKLLIRCGKQEEARSVLLELSVNKDFYGKSADWLLEPKNFDHAVGDSQYF